MGIITIQDETTKNPISLMGCEAGVCWGADTSDQEKNYQRGVKCIQSGHGRIMEYPQIYCIIDGYSARVIRELYTHIAGGPTRLQASTRYIDYEGKGFDYVVPRGLDSDQEMIYNRAMHDIQDKLKELISMGVPREDVALLLPLGMTTKIVLRTNLRNLVDMSRQRLCSRAYWEFRTLFKDLMEALSEYSPEWKECVDNLFMAKCEERGFCLESNSCGRVSSRKLPWIKNS